MKPAYASTLLVLSPMLCVACDPAPSDAAESPGMLGYVLTWDELGDLARGRR